jgi:hypothetical protein
MTESKKSRCSRVALRHEDQLDIPEDIPESRLDAGSPGAEGADPQCHEASGSLRAEVFFLSGGRDPRRISPRGTGGCPQMSRRRTSW